MSEVDRGISIVVTAVATVMVSAASVLSVGAQTASVEAALVFGRAVAESSAPPPTLSTVGITVSGWLTPHWGASWGITRSLDSQALDPPTNRPPFPDREGDRLYVSADKLSLQRITLRYRTPVSKRVVFVGGAGAQMAAGYDIHYLLVNSTGDVVAMTHRESWKGFAVEGLARVRVSSHFSVDTGVVSDFALDRRYLEPIIQTTFSFR